MSSFLKKYFLLITILFLVLLALSAWKFPSVAPVIGILFLVFSLGLAIFSIVAKQRAAYREGRITRLVFIRNTFLDVLGILLAMALAILLGRYAVGMVTKPIGDHTARLIAGILLGLLVGMGVGLFVNRAWGRLVKTSSTR